MVYVYRQEKERNLYPTGFPWVPSSMGSLKHALRPLFISLDWNLPVGKEDKPSPELRSSPCLPRLLREELRITGIYLEWWAYKGVDVYVSVAGLSTFTETVATGSGLFVGWQDCRGYLLDK